MSLATEIQEARRKLGLSQSQAAKAWDVKLFTLQSWERGRYEPEGLALRMLKQILDAAKEAKPSSPPSSASASETPPRRKPQKSKPLAPPKQKRSRRSARSATSSPAASAD